MNDEDIRNNIKNNLINLRKKYGLTQSDVADITEKKAPTIASWEQGISLPDLQTLYRLSKYYHVMLEYFYEHKEDES